MNDEEKHRFDRAAAEGIDAAGKAWIAQWFEKNTLPPQTPAQVLQQRAVAQDVLTAIKHTTYLHATDEQLMDAGVIADTRPSVCVPWRSRLRFWWWGKREQLGERIAGRRFEE